ncbi:hypothetical protein CTheo_6232 [Ceratobasidium theobromae]|uniref:Uncharacterized protein n=1 Tax=Ceratobasidium theobromae TaxID=1582974 RepID=A0A5N5QG92_9AGAM|nr:hypothetical protein CTheo_6232 [Ceratobasidium theobromae]
MHGATAGLPAHPQPTFATTDMTLTITPHHFLDLPHHVQPAAFDGIRPDTSTVAAHDFDVDVNTGFMPNQAPLLRIPKEVSAKLQVWEDALAEGLALNMKLGDQLAQYGPEETTKNELWRERIRSVSCRRVPRFGRRAKFLAQH